MAELRFTAAPDAEEGYQVGDIVEVFCDHDNHNGDRVRGWLTGVVVQVDPKIVAIQFEENVYLTDGWMVPDHVIWCPPDSAHMRHERKKKRRPRSSSKR
ncbi:hypothetical protein ACFLYP_01935 [Chloroflexota bacterium]